MPGQAPMSMKMRHGMTGIPKASIACR